MWGPPPSAVRRAQLDRLAPQRLRECSEMRFYITMKNSQCSRGADPCYITVDKTGKYVLVANYTGGSLAVFPVLRDGKLGEASAFLQHTGHGSDPKRQEGPHAHSIDLSPDNHLAMVDDLGLD